MAEREWNADGWDASVRLGVLVPARDHGRLFA